MKNILLTVLAISGLLIATTAKAQEKRHKQDMPKHELSVYGMGGYSPLSYSLTSNGVNSGGTGGGAGLGYTLNISPSLGIVTGVEIAVYSSEASFDNLQGTDSEGTGMGAFDFSYSLKNYKEKQSVTLFSIPVMAQYGLPLGSGSTKFYASGGLKLGFPVNAKADLTSGVATTSIYGKYEDVEYENIEYVNMTQHGIVTNESLPNASKDIDLGFSIALALEAGARFSLTDKIGLYTGVYFDYGLNSIQKVNDKHLLEYDKDNETTFKRHSVLNTGFTEKVNLMSIGLKIRIGFGL
jgi:hypothetical protein